MKYSCLKIYYDDGSVGDTLDPSKTLYREDGPAVVMYDADGKVRYETYYLEDKCHRVDGPAFIAYHMNGNIESEQYWLENRQYTKEEYYKIMEEVKNMEEAVKLTDPRKWVREFK